MHFLPRAVRAAEPAIAHGVLVIAVAMAPTIANAQAVDYTTLEQVFGEPITTSVTGKPQRASEAPGDITIITQDDIRRSGADNIPDILQFVTGIDIRRYSFGDAQVAIRGYDTPSNPRLLVMVDGRQIYLDDYGYVNWSAVPVQLDEIRQIEIVRGPNSALFGFNAVSGVINIITYDPLFDSVNAVTIRGGTQGYGATDAVGTGHIGDTAAVRLSAGGWIANDFPQAPSLFPTVSPQYGSFNADGRWQVTPDVLVNLSGGKTDTSYEQYFPIGLFSSTEDRLDFLRSGVAAETGIGTVAADAYRNQSVIHYSFGQGVAETYVAKLSDLVKLGSSNTIRVGFDARSDSIDTSAVGGTISYTNYAADAMWNWQIAPWLELTNAGRVDDLALHYDGTLLALPGRSTAEYDDTTITAPSFNSGVVIKASGEDTVRLLAARGLQLPSLLDFGAQTQVGQEIALGVASVVPEAVWNGELAYDRTVSPINGTVTTSIYFQRNTDLLDAPTTAPLTFVGRIPVSATQTIGSSNEVGISLGAKGQTNSGFRWNASYTLAAINQDLIAAAEETSSQNSLTRYSNGTPRHTVIAGVGYTTGPWETDVAGRWQSSYIDYEFKSVGFAPVDVSDYVVLNARVGYKLNEKITLSLTAEQFNESRLIVSAGDAIQRRIIAAATARF
jgi:iron complex outermembrane receptor protein